MVPKVSVVMPVYNAGGFLEEAVESVLTQTFEDFEFIVIDDGSADDSSAALRQFADARMRVVRQENRGLVASLNRGIELARGKYIARMDADDRCEPNRFDLQVDYLDHHPEIALLGGSIATMDENGNQLAPCVAFPAAHEQIWAGIGRRPWMFCHPAVMFRRDAAIEAGLYRSEFAHAEDAEFFARLMTRHQAANLPEVLLNYRLRRSAISFHKTEHGRINAQLVAKIIDGWKPGQMFEATPEQRREADAAVAACGQSTPANRVEAAYHCRVGRELLRGRQWRRALGHFAAAAKSDWQNRMAYIGIICSMLHYGGQDHRAQARPSQSGAH